MDGINNIISYLQSNPLIGIAVLLLLALMIYREPRFFLTVFLIGAVILAVAYLVFDISGVGMSHKETLINKSMP